MMSDQSILITPEHPLDEASELIALNSSPYNSRGTAAMELMRTTRHLVKERRGPHMGQWHYAYVVANLPALREEAKRYGVQLHGCPL
jgi:hypothetical protein